MCGRFEPRLWSVEVELISRTHHIDTDEPDTSGVVGWRYEYDILTLRTSDGLEGEARTYSDEPSAVTLLRFSLGGERVGQGDVRKSHSGALAALTAFLAGEGFESVGQL